MNHSSLSRRRRSGFTLVELLVVIAIIAILAGVTVVGVNSALKFAKRTKANSTATQISTAVQNYYTEYGVYPLQAGAAADVNYVGLASGQAAWQPLMYALCGNQNPYAPAAGAGAQGAVANTRSISYLSPTHSDVDQYGILINPFSTMANGVVKGPAANAAPYFYMEIDGSYSGVVGNNGGPIPPNFSATTIANPGANAVPGGVAVWSPCDQKLNGSPSGFWVHTY